MRRECCTTSLRSHPSRQLVTLPSYSTALSTPAPMAFISAWYSSPWVRMSMPWPQSCPYSKFENWEWKYAILLRRQDPSLSSLCRPSCFSMRMELLMETSSQGTVSNIELYFLPFLTTPGAQTALRASRRVIEPQGIPKALI